jgi:hypothetical protein
MNLKRYLLICYGLILGGLLLNYFAWWLSDPTLPLSTFIIFSFFQALFFSAFLWALAQSVPEERRTSFWSYRLSSGCLGAWLALVLVALLVALGSALL